MEKFIVEFGYECRGVEDISKVEELEVKDERDLVEKCLLIEFGEREKCEEYFLDFYGLDDMESIIGEVISMKNEDIENVYMSSEEGFFRVRKKGKS